MGIAIDFLIKHVRPIDDGTELLCGPEVRAGLRAYGMTDTEVTALFTGWRATAKLSSTDPHQDIEFARTAWTVAEARWGELYPTNKSTIVFLNAPLLKELSYQSSQHPGQNFTFDPHEMLPVAVTITKASGTYQIVKGASGFQAAADVAGLCIHFERLIP